MSALVLLLIVFVVLVLLAVPIPFAIGVSSLVILSMEPRMGTWLLTQKTVTGMSSFLLAAVPMFLFTGLLMSRAGITGRLIDFANAAVGHIRGGLGHVNVFVSMLFAGVSGSSTADTAGIGSVLIPAMNKEGYRPEISVAVTAASSTLGQIIPPSITMIIYGAAVDTSIGALFLAGIIPGILIALSQMSIVYVYSVKEGYKPTGRISLMALLRSGVRVILPMGTPVIIICGITFGWFTPTEASVIAAFYTLFLATVVYRSITWPEFWGTCTDTAYMSALTLFTIGIAATFGYITGFYRLSQVLTEILGGVVSSPSMTLIVLIGIFFLVGLVMDAAPAIIVLMPVLAPITIEAGLHPVHVGIVVIMTLAIGLVTPPYGLCLLLSCSIGGTSVVKVMPVMAWFLLAFFVVLFGIAFMPGLALWLPQMLVPSFL